MLKQAGYATGPGRQMASRPGRRAKTDFNGEIKPGPLELGFDYAFFIPATGDRVPCVFVENHRVVGYDPADPIQVSLRQEDRRTNPPGKDPGREAEDPRPAPATTTRWSTAFRASAS